MFQKIAEKFFPKKALSTNITYDRHLFLAPYPDVWFLTIAERTGDQLLPEARQYANYLARKYGGGHVVRQVFSDVTYMNLLGNTDIVRQVSETPVLSYKPAAV